MQNISAKRPFKLMLEQNDIPMTNDLFLTPEKKVKKGLSIEILDSFAESATVTPNRFSFHEKLPLLPLRSPRNSRSSRFSLSNIIEDHYSGKFGTENNNGIQKTSSNHDYDDFYLEGSYYDVTMRKCHRKTMEDRVISLISNRSNAFFRPSLSLFYRRINFLRYMMVTARHTSVIISNKISIKQSRSIHFLLKIQKPH